VAAQSLSDLTVSPLSTEIYFLKQYEFVGTDGKPTLLDPMDSGVSIFTLNASPVGGAMKLDFIVNFLGDVEGFLEEIPAISLGPIESQFVEFALLPDLFPGGIYEANITINVTELGTGDFIGNLDVPYKATIAAFPHPPNSVVTISPACGNLNISSTCQITVELFDFDGLPLTEAADALVFCQLKSERTGEVREMEERSISINTLEYTVLAFQVGLLFPKITISGVPILFEEQFQVQCGPNSSPDSSGLECVCDRAFRKTIDDECIPCTGCSPGFFATADVSQCLCRPCQAGFYCPTQVEEVECSLGHFCPQESITPHPCPEDSFSDKTRSIECQPCSVINEHSTTLGIAGATDSSFCTVCPKSAECIQLQPYSDFLGLEQCGENLNYQVAGTAGVESQPILFVAYAQPGFFRMPPAKETNRSFDDPCVSVEFYPCPNPEACPGEFGRSEDGEICSESHTGFLCQACANSFAHSGNECVPCSSSGPKVLAVTALVVLLVLTTYLSAKVVRKASKEYRVSSSFQVSGDTVVTILKIAYSHLQVLAIILALELDWFVPVDTLQTFAATLTISSSEAVSSLVCLFQNAGSSGFHGKIMIVFSVPFACMLIFALVWGCLSIWDLCTIRNKAGDYFFGWQVTVMILLFLTHIVFVRTALELFICTTPPIQGRRFLVADATIECFTGSHLIWFTFAGVGGILFYGCGIPIAAAWLVVRGKNKFLEMFLCKNFKERFTFWECIVAARKMILTVAVLAFAEFGPTVQGITCLLVLFFALILQLEMRPYQLPFLNQLESCGLWVGILSVSLALYSAEFSEPVVEVLGILVVIINVFFFLFVLYELGVLAIIFSCNSICKKHAEMLKTSERRNFEGRKAKRKKLGFKFESDGPGINYVVPDRDYEADDDSDNEENKNLPMSDNKDLQITAA